MHNCAGYAHTYNAVRDHRRSGSNALDSVSQLVQHGAYTMKEQSNPMWRNGQIPSSQEVPPVKKNDSNENAKQSNQKSGQNKSSH